MRTKFKYKTQIKACIQHMYFHYANEQPIFHEIGLQMREEGESCHEETSKPRERVLITTVIHKNIFDFKIY